MCGLVGLMIKAQNGFCNNEADALTNMLYMDALRGEDSTGVAALYNNGELEVAKDATPAWEFLVDKQYRSLSSRLISRGKAVMGHNRKKTVGKIDETTAHPFVLDDRYAFMHNGTLHSHKHLADTEVDSEALGIHLTKCKGDPRAIEEALSTVYGAYACVWLDLELETMYMLRNTERPLFLAETDSGYVFGSEYGFLAAACLRNRIKIVDFKQIEEHTLYTFDLSKKGVTLKQDTLVVKKVTPPSTQKQTVFGGHTKSSTSVEVSKNAFKRFRKATIGEPLSFYLDDWVEQDYPTVDGNWLIFGKSDNVEVTHIIRGFLYNVTGDDLTYMHKDKLHHGIVEDIMYEQKTKTAIISMKEIKRISASSLTKATWPYHTSALT